MLCDYMCVCVFDQKNVLFCCQCNQEFVFSNCDLPGFFAVQKIPMDTKNTSFQLGHISIYFFNLVQTLTRRRLHDGRIQKTNPHKLSMHNTCLYAYEYVWLFAKGFDCGFLFVWSLFWTLVINETRQIRMVGASGDTMFSIVLFCFILSHFREWFISKIQSTLITNEA